MSAANGGEEDLRRSRELHPRRGTITPRANVFRLHICVLGNSCAGKSCLLKRYCEDRFVSRYISTIGVDFGVKAVPIGDNFELRVQIWDLAGGAEYLEVRNEIYKDVQTAIFVYDSTNRDSFTALSGWVDEARRFNSDFAATAVAGTKSDCKPTVVTDAEARAWAAKNGMPCLSVSSSSGANVKVLFMSLFARALSGMTDAPKGIARAAVAAARAAAAAEGTTIDL